MQHAKKNKQQKQNLMTIERTVSSSSDSPWISLSVCVLIMDCHLQWNAIKGLTHSLRMSMREGVNSLMWDMRHSRVCTQTHILTHCSIHTHILTAAHTHSHCSTHTHVSGRTTDCGACRQLTTSTACPWQYIDDNDFHYNVLIAWCVRSGDRPSARCTHSLTSFVADYTLTVCDTWHTCLPKLLRGEQVVSKT